MPAKGPTDADASAASSSAGGSSDGEASIRGSTSAPSSASAEASASEDSSAGSSSSSNRSSRTDGSAPASDAEDDIDEPLNSVVSPSGDASAVELTKLRLQREQRLRRLLSQRHLGKPEPVSPNTLFSIRGALSEEDTVWLYSLTNAACFERLVAHVQATKSALAGNLDAVLAGANPLFHFNYRMPVPPPPEGAGSGADAVGPREAAEMQRWRAETPAVVRKRRTRADEAAAAEDDGVHGGAGRQSGRQAKASRSAAATTGLVAQSMRAWEAHLTASLTEEGETIDHFRQSRTKSSFTDKKEFQERAAWQEYRHEVRLQTEQRERAMKRALRRGETEGL